MLYRMRHQLTLHFGRPMYRVARRDGTGRHIVATAGFELGDSESLISSAFVRPLAVHRLLVVILNFPSDYVRGHL